MVSPRTAGTAPALLTILGHPAAHSLSPAMQGAAIAKTGLWAAYGLSDVPPGGLPSAVEGLRVLGFLGANVTLPHKEAVLAHLDGVTDEARRIGAVNTIVREGSTLLGDNTDGRGWARSLKEELGVDLYGMRAAVLGAGGAARAVVDALLAQGCESVAVYNRSPGRAVELATHFSSFYGSGRIFHGALQDLRLKESDLLVNTTPAGMAGHAEGMAPVREEVLRPGLIVSDIVYRPERTMLLRFAEQAGARTHGGLGMLVHQGAIAFERWFGVPAPVESMRSAARAALSPALPE